jgi:broad specificity phosphatase PhoE
MVSEAAPTAIYLVRHGETSWNVSGRLQGHLDSRLTPMGARQAEAMGCALRHRIRDLDQICIETSPLGRAYDTAKLIAESLGVKPERIVREPLLIEHHLGDWQGLTHSEIEALFPGALLKRRSRKWEYLVPGGESYAMVAARAKLWLAKQRFALTTIAVTHEMLSRTIQGTYGNLTVEKTLARSHRHDRIYQLCEGVIEEFSS